MTKEKKAGERYWKFMGTAESANINLKRRSIYPGEVVPVPASDPVNERLEIDKNFKEVKNQKGDE